MISTFFKEFIRGMVETFKYAIVSLYDSFTTDSFYFQLGSFTAVMSMIFTGLFILGMLIIKFHRP